MLGKVANIVKGLAADAVEKANSGHPGMPIGAAEIGSVLYGQLMKYDPQKTDWADRDRFILSAGHGSMLIYSLLHLAGFNLSMDDLKNFRQLNSKTPGHPEYGETEGVETTTGPLGQGFANAVGFALAERILAQKFNTTEHTIVDHFTYTILGDGGMMEGVVAEAASLAGHWGLGKLIAIYDDNDISIAGSTDLTLTESVPDRFKAYNWHVIEDVDGHDVNSLIDAFKAGKKVTDKPTLIVAKTHIAFGAPTKQDTSAAHGAPLGKDEIKGLKEKIGLPVDEEFFVSQDVKDFFAKRRKELKNLREEWENTFTAWSKANPELREAWDLGDKLELPQDFMEIVTAFKIKAAATRSSSGAILQKMAEEVPYLIGGSADLAPSNKTYLDKYDDIQQGEFKGRNLRFGVREHAMGSIANGLVLHKGLRPFVSTFLVFADYMRPPIRLAALMKQPVIYVFTHDSFYVGEDGPTHQPIEQLESLRIIPNVKVIRPADEEETKAAWIQAMERKDGPTALILTRQNLPHLDKIEGIDGFYRGGYMIEKEKGSTLDLVLIGSGSEVSLAVQVAEILRREGKSVRLVSIPDRKEFISQGEEYVGQVLGSKDALRVVLEAGIGQGWYQLLGEDYYLLSMESFGRSGPGEELAVEYGFEPGKIARDILNKVKGS